MSEGGGGQHKENIGERSRGQMIYQGYWPQMSLINEQDCHVLPHFREPQHHSNIEIQKGASSRNEETNEPFSKSTSIFKPIPAAIAIS
jgi:hypothetical protein